MVVKITYSDSEVDVFHPRVEQAVNEYLKSKPSLDSEFDIKHHPNKGDMEGIPDFVIRQKVSGMDEKYWKWVFVIEIKKTPNDVQSTAYWKQARGYVTNNCPYWKPRSQGFFMVSNIETSVIFLDIPTVEKQNTHECILESPPNCPDFGDDATYTIAKFSNEVVPKIFSYLGKNAGTGNTPASNFAGTFREIIKEFVNGQERLADNLQKNLVKITAGQNKISSILAMDCIFRIFIYEYCRELFAQKKIHAYLKKIEPDTKSIDKSIADCFAELQKMGFAQIFKKTFDFVPKNMDDNTRQIIGEFIKCVNKNMGYVIKQNGKNSDFIVNTIFDDEKLFPQQEIRKAGKVMTEPELSGLVTSLCFDKHGTNSIPMVLDPGCGTCNFLSYSYDQIKSENQGIDHNKILQHLHGCDSDLFLAKLGAFRLIMKSPADVNKDTTVNVTHTNFFDTPKTAKGKYDIVIMNPQFLGSGDSLLTLDKESIEDKLKKILGKESYMASASQPNNYFYFVELATVLLRDNGVAGFILMKTFLHNENAEVFKRFLLENFEILYVITIPQEYFFSDVTVSPCVVIVRKKKPCLSSTNKVKFVHILRRDFFKKNHAEILNSDQKEETTRQKIINQKDLKPEDNWYKKYFLPSSGDYDLFIPPHPTFQTLGKIFKIKRGECGNDGGTEWFFPWSTKTCKNGFKFRKEFKNEIAGIEKSLKKLGSKNADDISNYIITRKDLQKQPVLGKESKDTLQANPGFKKFRDKIKRESKKIRKD